MTDSIEMQQVFEPANDVLVSDVGEKKVLMSMDTGRFIELNATGRAIWERLDGKRSLCDIASELLGIYDLSRDRCETEILQFVGTLRDHSLVAPAS